MSTENTIEDLKNRTPGGFGVTVETLKPTEQDIRVLSAQLGRKVRDVVEIPARCVCGNPLVAATAPRLSNGTPFPTVFYLAHPVITAAASRLEAGGLMYEMTDALTEDAELAAAYAAAHENYLAERERIRLISGTDEVPEIDGISAGGMPTRVKCLHAVIGHTLSVGRYRRMVDPRGMLLRPRLARGSLNTDFDAPAPSPVTARAHNR